MSVICKHTHTHTHLARLHTLNTLLLILESNLEENQRQNKTNLQLNCLVFFFFNDKTDSNVAV